MIRVATIREVRERSRAQRSAGRRVGLVPTMGYLHEGHLSLVREARHRADWVVVSIFVNPTQFGPGEDLATYPRDLERDAELCAEQGVDAVFLPSVAEMYPEGFQTRIAVEGLSDVLCGASRPGHFAGVATVVAKLLNCVEPDVAVFGEKDYQQLLVIRRMVTDLDLPVEIVGAPIVREPDGLAMSSRNSYLNQEQRLQARCLSLSLDRAEEMVAAGENRPDAIRAAVAEVIRSSGLHADYIEVLDPATLRPGPSKDGRILVALAVFAGPARLIDNRVLRLTP